MRRGIPRLKSAGLNRLGHKPVVEGELLNFGWVLTMMRGIVMTNFESGHTLVVVLAYTKHDHLLNG